MLGLAADAPIPADQLAAVKMGTTVATNALLERKGDRTVFVTNQGFGDILRIGYQTRPDLFARHIVLPELLYERVVEVPGRRPKPGCSRRLTPASARSLLLLCTATATRSTNAAWPRSPPTSALAKFQLRTKPAR